MTDTTGVARECRVFTRYLAGMSPDAYIEKKYTAAFVSGGTLTRSLQGDNAGRFDEILLAVASVNPWLTRAMDIYSRFFYPHSGLRKRLILLLAILESWAPSYERLDRRKGNEGLSLIVISLLVNGLLAASLLLLAVPIMLPLQLLFRNKPGRYRAAA